MKTQDLAYVLHRRPYRETSFLVDFFTQEQGIITAVCRGVRRSKNTLGLECFHPFWIEYVNRPNLATLYQWELAEPSLSALQGARLYCGLYINELLIKLLGRHDPYPEMYVMYQNTLQKLSQEGEFEEALRLFELYLLGETGYGICLEKEVEGHLPILEDKFYYYRPGVGFTLANQVFSSSKPPFIFEGKTIKAIAEENFTEKETLKEAKRLIRLTLEALLEKQGPLKSRSLFLRG
jgi:DNA repair protein RecO (recombination protein O)